MGKYSRRRVFKALRMGGMDFQTAARLAKPLDRSPSFYELLEVAEKAGMLAEFEPNYCSCCGPSTVMVKGFNGKVYSFHYGKFEGEVPGYVFGQPGYRRD